MSIKSVFFPREEWEHKSSLCKKEYCGDGVRKRNKQRINAGVFDILFPFLAVMWYWLASSFFKRRKLKEAKCTHKWKLWLLFYSVENTFLFFSQAKWSRRRRVFYSFACNALLFFPWLVGILSNLYAVRWSTPLL